MPRLFIAIELPDPVKDQVLALQTQIPGATWVKRHALHLTLRFLGDQVEQARVEPIKSALTAVRVKPFELSLRQTGRFPPGTNRPPRVLWVGISPQPALPALHRQIERALADVGFPPDDRAFSPHITLARLKPPQGADAAAAFLNHSSRFHGESFTVDRFHLISSLLSPQGPSYQYLASFPPDNG
jgi:2'-5' RNA ligase